MITQLIAGITAKLVSIGAWCQVIGDDDAAAEETGAPPRITMIARDESFEPPENPGGNPRPLHDRRVGFEVILWGSTRDNTEGLIDQYVIALHRAIKDTSTAPHARGATYHLGKGRWDRKTNLAKLGSQYRLIVEIVVPVLDRDWSQTPAAEPDASTYTGTQLLTWPKVPDGTQIVASVARGDDAASGDAGDAVDVASQNLPTLDTIDPASASSAGGDPIALTGTWLEGATCTVGGSDAPVMASAYGTLTILMPAVAPGDHDVVATTAAGASNALTITAT